LPEEQASFHGRAGIDPWPSSSRGLPLELYGYAPARAWEVVVLPITCRPRGGAVECVAKIFPNLLKKVLDKDDLLWYLSKY
jgi:hypothetical protein